MWRIGRHLGRTVYIQQGWLPSDDDKVIGMMDTRELAERVVQSVNDGRSDFLADDMEFGKELERLLNRHSVDSALNVPDFILADYLIDTLWNLKNMVAARDNWGRVPTGEAESPAN